MGNCVCGILGGGTKAPFLHKYFEMLLEQVKSAPGGLDSLELMFNNEKRKEMEAKSKKLKGKLFNVIVESFKLHDKKGDNILSKDEAAVFFADYMVEWKKFAVQLGEVMAQKAQVGTMVQNMPKEMRKQIEKELKPMLDQIKKETKAKAEANFQRYSDNMDAFNAKAFAVMDKDGSGALELNEVISALTPDTPQNEQFSLALGILTQEELEMARMTQDLLKPGAGAGGPGDCPTQ